MPLPLLFIGLAGVATATGTVGAGKTIKAGFDANSAKKINKDANELIQETSDNVNAQRSACGRSLTALGEEKLYILNSNITGFINSFSKIKNVNFQEAVGIEEIEKLHIDEADFDELKEMVNFAGNVAKGTMAGTAGGALIAYGAYNAAQAFACASTGTAISALSGAAASNATLAFFGGGSIASGGLGMAVGSVVLNGLVAGPALLVLGCVSGSAAKKNLEKAYTNRAEALQISEELNTAAAQCAAIRRRTYVFYNLLARLDAKFLPMLYKLEDIIEHEGTDYRAYTAEAKKVIASCVSTAVTIKAVLDTPLLTEDGELSAESEQLLSEQI